VDLFDCFRLPRRRDRHAERADPPYRASWRARRSPTPGAAAQKLAICVEIDLIEQPDATLMRLTHTGLPNAEQCASHAEGWAHYFGRLAEVAAGRDPGPDPWHGRTG